MPYIIGKVSIQTVNCSLSYILVISCGIEKFSNEPLRPSSVQFNPLCLYFWAIDFAVLSLIWLFQDVSRWRLRNIVMDLGRALKANSYVYSRMILKALNWGDNASKALSADYDPARDYEAEMMPPGSILGSPMSKILGGMKYGGWPINPIPEEYRKLQYSEVETLMVNGNIDFSTPAENAKDELLPHLTNGNLVILSEMGHSSDVVNTQPDAFRHLDIESVNSIFHSNTSLPPRFRWQRPTAKPHTQPRPIGSDPCLDRA
jgi:hypothetical protein